MTAARGAGVTFRVVREDPRPPPDPVPGIDPAASAPLVFESCALGTASPESGRTAMNVSLQRMSKPSFIEIAVEQYLLNRELDQVLDPAH
jgi:hypothetical protein